MADVLVEWQCVIGDQTADAALRPVIRESWHRCRMAGVKPEPPRETLVRRVSDAELTLRLAARAELVELARPHLEWLSSTYAALPHVAFVVDRDGIILCSTGTDLEGMRTTGILPGCDWSEAAIGTNGAGTALLAGEPVLVEGAEHFARPWHGRTCTGAPLLGPGEEVLGAINLSTGIVPGAAERLVAVAHAAFAIGRELRLRESQRPTSDDVAAERRCTRHAAHSLAAEQTARAEAALREIENRYAHIAANVPGMVYQFVYRADGTTGYTFVSEGVRTIFGVAPEDALRDPAALLDLVHPDDYPQFQALSREAAATLGPFRWEGRVVLASGEERFIHVAARDQRLPDGGVASDGLVMDITELRDTARRLEESEQRYRSLFDHHPDGVYSLDLEGRFMSVNPACAAVAGYAPEEMLGQSFAPLVVPEDLDRVTANFRANVAGASTHLEAAIRHRSGRRVQLGVTGMPIIIDGRVVGVFGIAKDLTAQRELEAQLRQAQKMEAVGRLAGGVAHDFNNLLLVIQTYCGLASSQLPMDAAVQADLAEALKATKRAAALTRQLLAFSRQQVLKPRRLDVNESVASVAAMLRRVIGEDIRLETELAPTVWPVHADPGQLEQVLMNLAVNARDAMPDGGTLRLRTAAVTMDEQSALERPGLAPGQYAALLVEDTGIGIPPAALQTIFEPFYTTKGPGKGTGLGLATVYGIVEQSGGYIYADSTPGVGTRFTVLLPRLRDSDAGQGEMSRAPALPRGTETILLVEDDPAVRAVVRRLLERLGYTVREATNGVEALGIATARAARIDLVLTDVVMPEMSGRALVEQLAACRPELRAVHMSGYTDDEILRRGLMQPDTAFLEKPFTLERLAHIVRRALDGPHARLTRRR